MKCIAIILSGGTGSRMNMEIPKQYVKVNGRMIITDSIIPFVKCGLIDGIQIVAEKTWRDSICAEYREHMIADISGIDLSEGVHSNVLDKGGTPEQGSMLKFCGFSSPGANRQLSIYNALRDIRQDMEEDDIVIIHDAARPLVTVEMITEYIKAICEKSSSSRPDVMELSDQGDLPVGEPDSMEVSSEGKNGGMHSEILHDGVMPVISLKDTIYYSEDGHGVDSLLERDKLYAGQAPEVFRYGKYLEACERLVPDKIMAIRGSTEPAIMAGMDVIMVSGDERNFKITTREDMKRYIEIVNAG